ASLWTTKATNGSDMGANVLMNAATFPDDARAAGPFSHFNRPTWHFVNFGIRPLSTTLTPPPPGINLLTSIESNRTTARTVTFTPADRAVAVSWICHLVGDIHQPLHNVARFSAAFPEGDRGGNAVVFPNPRGPDNLHSYWDELLGSDGVFNTFPEL